MISGESSLTSEGFRGRRRGTCKRRRKGTAQGDLQCAIYTFLLWILHEMGFLAQYSLFWQFLDPMVWREITRKSFEGSRYSVFGHEDLHGRVLLVSLDHLSGSWTKVARLLDFGVEQIVWR